ncbi:hypothetical protein HY745_11880 [Candidatus Desantisbacteria bacterium]|nr:hypothetical protein [Candidatus Desantisbacteria bacterium]
MSLVYYYLKNKNSKLFDFINFIVSMCAHIILFFLLNTIPNVVSQPASWTQVHTVKQKGEAGKSWARGIEVINMVPPNEIKVVEGQNKDKSGKLKKINLVKKGKGKLKKGFNPKINFANKTEAGPEKLVPKKNDIKETKVLEKSASAPRIKSGERGVRSITEKSPLSSPPTAKVGQPSKKTGGDEGPKDKYAQKAPPKPAPLKKVEVAKSSIPEPVKIIKKTMIAPKAVIPVKREIEKIEPIAKAEDKKIEIKKPEEKMEKLEEKAPDIVPKPEEISKQEKIFKDITSEIMKKSKISEPNLTRVAEQPKKISITAKTEVVASEKAKDISIPEENKDIKKVDIKDQFKLGSPAGAFENKIKDIEGEGPPVSFAVKGDKELSKALRTTAEIDNIKISEKEMSKTLEEIERIDTKTVRTITQGTILKNRSTIEPVLSREPRHIKMASLSPSEQQEIKSEDKSEERSKEVLKPEEKFVKAEEINKLMEELKKEEEKKVAENKFDTSLESEFALLNQKEEVNKDAKIIGMENIVASGDKGQSIETIKIKRTFDRNPMSVTKRTPLTHVSNVGSTRQVVTKDMSSDEVKKVEKQIEKIKKTALVTGEGGGTALFSPIINRIDLDSLLAQEEEIGVSQGEKTGSQFDGTGEEASGFDINPEPDKEIVQDFKSYEKKSKSDKSFSEKETFNLSEGGAGGELSGLGKTSGGKDTFIGLKDKQLTEIEKHGREITSFQKARVISIRKGKFPMIKIVAHDATHTLGKGDELVVTLSGDPGEKASFDIGLFRTDIDMNEISPGVYRGYYRVMEGDNIVDATIVGYLMNRQNNQQSMAASKTVSIDTSPGVTIATPPRDSTVDKAVQTVTGVVDDPEVKNVVLSLNGSMRNVIVENGFFNTDVDLLKGKNIVEVMAVNSRGDVGRDKIEITYATYKAGPKVTITFPNDGDMVNLAESLVLEVQGTISDISLTKAKLLINDLPMDISVQDGEFKQKIVVFSEINSVVVQAINKEGTIGMSEPITVKATGLGHYDAIISLYWDTPQADVDLIVRRGEKFISHKAQNFRMNPNAIPEGELQLDDMQGFGPEVITLRQATSGLYSVHAAYYEANGDKSVNATISITLTDQNDPTKITSKVFGPKTMNVGEEWKVIFIGIPEMRFYAVE